MLIGRPVLWSLATGGAEGVAGLLGWFERELRRVMALCGAPSVSALDRSLVRPAGPARPLGGAVTTVARLLAARADDDHPGVLAETGSWSWREAVAAGARAGRAGRPAPASRSLPPGRPAAQRPRVPLLAERRRPGRGDGGGHQPHPPGRRPGRRRPGHRLPAHRDRRGGREPAGRPRPRRRRRPRARGGAPGTTAPCSTRPTATGPQARALVEPRRRRRPRTSSSSCCSPPAPPARPRRCAAPRDAWPPSPRWRPPATATAATSVCYCAMPLFHGNALMALWGPALFVGATVAVRPRFSASAFLDDVRRYRATMFNYVGKAIAYILATPERPDDADNTLVSGFGTEASLRDRSRFYKRFGCVLLEGYGQSEGGATIHPARGMPKGALGQAAARSRPGRRRPGHRRRVPAGRLRRRGEAAQRRRGHRGDREPQRPGGLRGLLRRPRGRGRADPPRLVLDRRPRLPRRRRLLLLRRAARRLAPGRLGELRRRPGRDGALAPPRPLGGRRLRRARHDDRRGRPGDGRRRAAARRRLRPRRLRPLAGRPARPRHQVGPALRAALDRAAPDRHRQGDQGRPAHRALGHRDEVWWRPGGPWTAATAPSPTRTGRAGGRAGRPAGGGP